MPIAVTLIDDNVASLELMAAAIGELFLDWCVLRHVRLDVGAVDAVNLALFQASLLEEPHQLVVEDDVNVGGENDLAAASGRGLKHPRLHLGRERRVDRQDHKRQKPKVYSSQEVS